MDLSYKNYFAIALANGMFLFPTVADAETAQQKFDQNMKNAEQVYKQQQQEQQKQQMKEYQKNSGSFVPGPFDKSVGKDTYVSPSYNNGAVGGTVTKTFK